MTTTTNIAPHTGTANDLVWAEGEEGEEVCKYIYVPNVWQNKGDWTHGIIGSLSHDSIIRRGNTKVTTIYG